MSTASVKAAQKFADAIAKDEFLRDANVDLRGFPSMQPVEDTSFEDDRFAPLSGSGSQDAKDSRAFLRQQIDEGEGSSVVHVGENQFRVFYRDGAWYADGEANGKRHRYSAADKDALYGKLVRLARRNQEEAIHTLTEGEKLQVVRIAQGGAIREAIGRFLELSIGEERANQYENPTDMLGDPALAVVFDEAAALTWFAARPRVQDSEEFQEFLQDYRGGRPLTHDLLDGAYSAFSDRRNRLVYSDLPRAQGTPPEQVLESVPTASALENMNDQEIEAQMKRQARFNAQAAHGPRAPYPQGHAYLEAEAAAVA